jgi:ketosteroid isomerase-like protein
MAREDVEFVERAIAAFNARDFPTLYEISHPELEFTSILIAVDSGGATWHGRDAWQRYFAAMDEMWESWRIADVEIHDGAEPGRIACTLSIGGTGRHSGVPVDRRIGVSYLIRGGQVVRLTAHPDPADALREVGAEP